MHSDSAIELCRNALMTAAECAGPVLVAGLVTGIVVGLIQSLFQVHDQIAGMVPRLAAMLLVMLLMMPWMAGRITEYGRQHFSQPLLVPQSGSVVELPMVEEPASWPGN